MTTRNRELAGIIDDSGNITATGNLTVAGNLAQQSSTTTTYADNLLELNTGAGSNSNDLGFVFERGSTGDNAILIWDESNDGFIVGTTSSTGSATGNITVTAGDFAAGKITVDNILINGTTIGHTSDTDLLTFASGVLTVAGEVSMTTLDIGGTNVTSTAAELNILDGVNSTAAELNILDGVTATAAEINFLDGDTSATGTTLASADRVIVNDGGTMKQVALSDFETFFESEIDTFSTIDINGGSIDGATVGANSASSGAFTTLSASGALTGTLGTAAQTNITSLGTLTALTVDNIIINGTTIGHTSDTDSISIASNGIVTFSQIPVLPANSIDSDHYVDASIDNAHLADDAVGVAELSATGTASNSTYLRGDNSWAALTAASITSYTNSTNNRILTSVDSATVNSEANLTFDGSTLAVTGAATISTTLGVTGASTLTGAVMIGGTLHNEWHSDYIGLELGHSGFLYNRTAGNELFASSNAYYDSGWKYAASGRASMLDLQAGRIRARTSNASGSQDGAITWVTALDIAADSGNTTIAGTLGVTGETTLSTHLNMGDSDIIKLGAGADLQIKHDGSDSTIIDSGTGNLLVGSNSFYLRNAANNETMLRADENSYVKLYYDNGERLATTTGGVDITGTLGVTGAVTIPNTDSGQVNNESHVLIRDLANGKVITDDGLKMNCAENKFTVGGGTFITSGYIRSGIAHMKMGTASRGELFVLNDTTGSTMVKGGAQAAVSQLLLNNGTVTLADDATLVVSSAGNTGAIIAVGSTKNTSNGVAYMHALFFVHYGIGMTGVIEMADPAGQYSTNDTDGKMCCISAAGSGDVTIKNRMGHTTGVSVSVIAFQGN